MPLPTIAHGAFKFALIASSGGILVRIRRADGSAIIFNGIEQAAIGTRPFATQQEALDEAKAIIRRKGWDHEV